MGRRLESERNGKQVWVGTSVVRVRALKGLGPRDPDASQVGRLRPEGLGPHGGRSHHDTPPKKGRASVPADVCRSADGQEWGNHPHQHLKKQKMLGCMTGVGVNPPTSVSSLATSDRRAVVPVDHRDNDGLRALLLSPGTIA